MRYEQVSVMKRIVLASMIVTALPFAFSLATGIGEVRAEDVSGGVGVTERCKKEFAQHDKNGNGVIEREEIYASLEAQFKKMDRDNNGKITMDDVLAPELHREIREGMSKKPFHELMPEDVNTDGSVTLAEYRDFVGSKLRKEPITLEEYCSRMEESCRRGFAKVDGNRNGVIDEDELLAALEVEFKKRDRDKDGKISMDDVLTRDLHEKMREDMLKKPFHALVPEDLNKDGSATAAEYQDYVVGKIKREFGRDTAVGLTLKESCDRSVNTRGRE